MQSLLRSADSRMAERVFQISLNRFSYFSRENWNYFARDSIERSEIVQTHVGIESVSSCASLISQILQKRSSTARTSFDEIRSVPLAYISAIALARSTFGQVDEANGILRSWRCVVTCNANCACLIAPQLGLYSCCGAQPELVLV